MEVSMLVSVVLGLLVFVLLYVWFMSSTHGQLEKYGFFCPKTTWVIGHITVKTFLQQEDRYYQQYKHKKAIALYMGRFPIIMITDLDLVKEVTIKKFQYFSNRSPKLPRGGPLNYILTSLRGSHWKHVRTTISPTFSTAKIKSMCRHVETSSKILVENIRDSLEMKEAVEMAQKFSHFSMDVIGSAGFGVQINSMKDPKDPFVVAAKTVASQIFLKNLSLIIFAPFLIPLIYILGLSRVNREAVNTLTMLVDKAMNSRREEEEHKGQTDFLQLLINADELAQQGTDTSSTDGHRKGLSKLEIQGSAITFLLGGYSTLSTTLSFNLFLLAVHPDILRKVQEELDGQLGTAFPTYENVQSLSYLHMCISEGLRLYPPGFSLDRWCEKTITLMGLEFPANVGLSIPVYSIHRDPDLWPDPDKYNPERFSPENQTNRHPCAYMPFGMGPRGCIASRLALMELRIVMATILQVLTPVTCEKTMYPIRLLPLRMEAQDGLWVRFEKRI